MLGSHNALTDIASIRPEPLQSEVKIAFADSLKVLWTALIPISGAALLLSLTMKSLPLAEVTDEEWGIHDDQEKASYAAVQVGDLEQAQA
jgi:hypothetical protein